VADWIKGDRTMANRPNYLSETNVLRKVAKDARCRWIFTKHSLIELQNDQRTAEDIRYLCMTNGQVTLQEVKQDLLWRVEGRGIDGEWIEAVVAVFETTIKIKVITAF
jgi:hypothetical protein